MKTKNLRIEREDTWKYSIVTYENNDPSMPMAQIHYDDNGNIVEQSTYSSRYLNTLHNGQDVTRKDKKKRKVSASDIGEGAAEVLTSAMRLPISVLSPIVIEKWHD